MPRVMAILMTLMVVLPSDGSSQAVPSPGDRIRIKQVDGTILTGTLATVSAETIRLSVASDDRMAQVPVAQIELLEISLGRGTSPKNAGILLGAGGVLGAVPQK